MFSFFDGGSVLGYKVMYTAVAKGVGSYNQKVTKKNTQVHSLPHHSHNPMGR